MERLARDRREWAEWKKARLSIWRCTAGPRLRFAIVDWKGSLSPRHQIFIYWNRVMINLHCHDVPRIGLKELPWAVHNPTAIRTSQGSRINLSDSRKRRRAPGNERGMGAGAMGLKRRGSTPDEAQGGEGRAGEGGTQKRGLCRHTTEYKRISPPPPLPPSLAPPPPSPGSLPRLKPPPSTWL